MVPQSCLLALIAKSIEKCSPDCVTICPVKCNAPFFPKFCQIYKESPGSNDLYFLISSVQFHLNTLMVY